MKLPVPHTRAATVVAYLAKVGTATSAEIGDLIDQTPGEVSTLMSEWAKRSLVERVGSIPARRGAHMGVWALTEACAAELDKCNGSAVGANNPTAAAA